MAPCLSLIGLAVLGEIFIFFPSDMIRFVEARAEQRRRGAQSPLFPGPAVPPALCQEKACSGALLRSWCGHHSGHLEELEYHKQPGEYPVGSSVDILGNNTKSMAGGHSHKEHEAGRFWSSLARLLYPQNPAGTHQGETKQWERGWFSFWMHSH